MSLPGKMTGNGPLEHWLNKLREYVGANVISSVDGGRFSNQGPSGKTLVIPKAFGGAGQTLQLMQILSDATNSLAVSPILLCRMATAKDDGTYDVVGPDISVAKPYHMRVRPTFITDVTAVIHPPYVITDSPPYSAWPAQYIFALKNPVGGTGVFIPNPDNPSVKIQLEWLSVADGRNWATQVPTCINNVNYFINVVGSNFYT